LVGRALQREQQRLSSIRASSRLNSSTAMTRNQRIALLRHWELIILFLLLTTGFLLRIVPLLSYPHVGGDPFLHYRYSMALLNGRFNVAVQAGDAGSKIDLYYPPLFHLVSLVFFLAFPAADPYMIMKVLASAFDIMQIIPIYLIVKKLTNSGPAALLASFALLTVRSDYEMLSWGGYANILGLLLIVSLVYVVMTERFVASAVISALLALTHDLSAVFMFAVLVPYFVFRIWNERAFPKSLLGCSLGGVAAYVLFYQWAIPSILEYYTKYTPQYDQSLYITPYILEQVGPLLLSSALIVCALAYAHARGAFLTGNKVLMIWAIVPLLLSYAYLFGVQWHGVRWIAFIPQPLAVLTGVGLEFVYKKKMVLIVLALLFTVQLFLVIQAYHFDILKNLVQ
jgi:hypothetical protein